MTARDVVRRRPLVVYFAGAYLLSAIALTVIGLPKPRGTSNEHPLISLIMFPVMVFGVAGLGIGLTALTSGRPGLDGLRGRLRQPVSRCWWLLGLIPPAAVLVVLELLTATGSNDYQPGFLIFGLGAGLVAGFFEEFGWTGYAYPRMSSRFGPLPGALMLGTLWALWHLPVVDSLGAASPHGSAWPAFFAAFVAVLVALRVLIAWAYTTTASLRLAQLLHASSTGSLVVFGAPGVSPSQEALWYACYAAVLSVVVAIVVWRHRGNLGKATARPVDLSSLSAPVAQRA